MTTAIKTPTVTQNFIISTITGGYTNPLNTFNSMYVHFDFSDKDLWMAVALKALEHSSNYRDLAETLISEDLIEVNELLLKAAALQYIQVKMVKNQYESSLETLNGFMNHFEGKFVATNPIVDSMISYCEAIFNNASNELIADLKKYLTESDLKAYVNFFDAFGNQ